MQLNRVMAVVVRQYYLLRGSLARLLPIFVWSAVNIAVWGFITRFLGSLASGYNFVTMLLGAALLWDFLVRVMHQTSMTFMEDMWSRNFLNIFASPITIGEYLMGIVISSIVLSLLSLVVMLIFAYAAFGLSVFAYGMAIIPFLLILFLFGLALGIVGCAVLLRFGPAAEWCIWPIPGVISPFACVFYPLHMLPHAMQILSYALPPMYVFESIRSSVTGGPVPENALLISGVLVVFYLVAACAFYARTYKSVVKAGLIARYSAESVA